MSAPSAPARQNPYQMPQILGAEAMTLENKWLPSYLNIFSNPLFNPQSPQAQSYMNQQADAYYNQVGAPAVAKVQTGGLQSGMENSSSGGANIADMMASQRAQAGLYGTQAYEGLLGGLNQTSQGFFGGPGNLALEGLGTANNLNSSIYSTQGKIYGSQLGALGSLAGGGKGGGGNPGQFLGGGWGGGGSGSSFTPGFGSSAMAGGGGLPFNSSDFTILD